MSLGLGVIAFDEEHRIVELLNTCAKFCDEMLVVDQGSTDATARLAKQCGASVVSDVNRGFADPSRPLLLKSLDTDWVLMLDADEEPTSALIAALPDLMTTRGAYLRRENYIGGMLFTTDTHYRLFPRDNVTFGLTLHSKHHPWNDTLVVSPQFVAIDHSKSFDEQLRDDESYETLGQTHHPILDKARAAGLTGAEIDRLPLDERGRFMP